MNLLGTQSGLSACPCAELSPDTVVRTGWSALDPISQFEQDD